MAFLGLYTFPDYDYAYEFIGCAVRVCRGRQHSPGCSSKSSHVANLLIGVLFSVTLNIVWSGAL